MELLAQITVLAQPTGKVRLGEYLKQQLEEGGWEEFRCAVAFVKRSGVQHISEGLRDFSRTGKITIAVGVDCRGTSFEGLRDLLECLEGRGDIFVFHNEGNYVFHPKVYVFKCKDKALVVVGSGNLTQGGLFTNYEAALSVSLNLNHESSRELLAHVDRMLDEWTREGTPTCVKLTKKSLEELRSADYVLPEAELGAIEVEGGQPPDIIGIRRRKGKPAIFGRVAVPRAPYVRRAPTKGPKRIERPASRGEECPSGFVMTLHRTDVGHGQLTPGTSRRSPEIFIPLAARDFAPRFWGWRDEFHEDPEKPGKWDRPGVRMRVGSEVIVVNMMTWPDKHDFRLRSEKLRSAGNVGDIFRMERTTGEGGVQYQVQVISRNALEFRKYRRYCRNPVPNSRKRWGYY